MKGELNCLPMVVSLELMKGILSLNSIGSLARKNGYLDTVKTIEKGILYFAKTSHVSE